ncbi:hypothetical protein ACVXHA_17135 [Escherichia coli]
MRTSTTPDIIIMSILLIQCLLGDNHTVSAQYPDGSEMMKLVGWARSGCHFPWWIVRNA